jgi:hypothetical protein
MYGRKQTRFFFAIATVLAAGESPGATDITVPVRASVPAAPVVRTPPGIDWKAPVAEELVPPVPYTARIVAHIKTYVVTASYDGRPYRVMTVVVDSTGLAYSASQQGSDWVHDDESQDALRVRVTSLSPVIFDVAASKADAHAAASRDRVAVDDLPQGHAAFALKDHGLAVEVRRLDDQIELR